MRKLARAAPRYVVRVAPAAANLAVKVGPALVVRGVWRGPALAARLARKAWTLTAPGQEETRGSSWRRGVVTLGRWSAGVAGAVTLAGWATTLASPVGPIILSVGCGLSLLSAPPGWAMPADGRMRYAMRTAEFIGVGLFFATAVMAAVLGSTHVGLGVTAAAYSLMLLRYMAMAWQGRKGGLRAALATGLYEIVPFAGVVVGLTQRIAAGLSAPGGR